jgi:hypothetical protein
MAKLELAVLLASAALFAGTVGLALKTLIDQDKDKCLAVYAGIISDNGEYSNLLKNIVIESVLTNSDNYVINYLEKKSKIVNKKSLEHNGGGWYTSM